MSETESSCSTVVCSVCDMTSRKRQWSETSSYTKRQRTDDNNDTETELEDLQHDIFEQSCMFFQLESAGADLSQLSERKQLIHELITLYDFVKKRYVAAKLEQLIV